MLIRQVIRVSKSATRRCIYLFIYLCILLLFFWFFWGFFESHRAMALVSWNAYLSAIVCMNGCVFYPSVLILCHCYPLWISHISIAGYVFVYFLQYSNINLIFPFCLTSLSLIVEMWVHYKIWNNTRHIGRHSDISNWIFHNFNEVLCTITEFLYFCGRYREDNDDDDQNITFSFPWRHECEYQTIEWSRISAT